MPFIRILCLFLVLGGFAGRAAAHPWGGIVTLEDGTLLFSTVCPLDSDGHRTCVYSLAEEGPPRIVLRAERDPSDIVLTLSPGGEAYAAERDGTDGSWRSRLWRRAPDGEWILVIGPTTDETEFAVNAYAVTGVPGDEWLVYASADGQRLYRRRLDGVSEPWISEPWIGEARGPRDGPRDRARFWRVSDMATGPDGALFVIDRRGLRRVFRDGEVTTISQDVVRNDPPNLPFRGANVIFDITVDEKGTSYLAYYGNRQVLKVSPSGEETVILESEAPWSPSGVTRRDGKLIVMEASFPPIRPDVPIDIRIRELGTDGDTVTLFRSNP